MTSILFLGSLPTRENQNYRYTDVRYITLPQLPLPATIRFMSSLRTAILYSLIYAITVTMVSCLPEGLAPGPAGEKLPVVRTLVDSLGREVEATVIGREAKHITFLRTADDQLFRYAISSLSTPDQEWAISLPLTSPKPAQVADGANHNFPDFKEAEISKLEKEIAEATRIARDLPFDTIKWRAQVRHIERLKNRLSRLKHNTL